MECDVVERIWEELDYGQDISGENEGDHSEYL